MEKYLYETHCHTIPASLCSGATGEEMADFYKSKGYTGIIVTDHFFNGNTGIDRSLPWNEKVEQFCIGYENAKKRGEEIGLDVFFGFEYNKNGAEFLVYGLDKAWLLQHEEIMNMRVSEFYKLVCESGGAMIQAHPFRQAPYLERIVIYPEYCDGAEVVNTANNFFCNQNAIWYANTFKLFATCGSDCHWVGREDLGGVYTSRKLQSINDYVSVIKNKEQIELYEMKPMNYDFMQNSDLR